MANLKAQTGQKRRTQGMVKLTDNQQYVVDESTVKIVTTDRTQIMGIVNKKGLERTSDLFTKDDSPFIIVYKAIAKGHENKAKV